MKNGDTKSDRVKTPKQKLMEAAKKKGGAEANRRALEELQEFVSKEMKGLNMQQTAWK